MTLSHIVARFAQACYSQMDTILDLSEKDKAIKEFKSKFSSLLKKILNIVEFEYHKELVLALNGIEYIEKLDEKFSSTANSLMNIWTKMLLAMLPRYDLETALEVMVLGHCRLPLSMLPEKKTEIDLKDAKEEIGLLLKIALLKVKLPSNMRKFKIVESHCVFDLDWANILVTISGELTDFKFQILEFNCRQMKVNLFLLQNALNESWSVLGTKLKKLEMTLKLDQFYKYIGGQYKVGEKLEFRLWKECPYINTLVTIELHEDTLIAKSKFGEIQMCQNAEEFLFHVKGIAAYAKLKLIANDLHIEMSKSLILEIGNERCEIVVSASGKIRMLNMENKVLINCLEQRNGALRELEHWRKRKTIESMLSIPGSFLLADSLVLNRRGLHLVFDGKWKIVVFEDASMHNWNILQQVEIPSFEESDFEIFKLAVKSCKQESEFEFRFERVFIQYKDSVVFLNQIPFQDWTFNSIQEFIGKVNEFHEFINENAEIRVENVVISPHGIKVETDFDSTLFCSYLAVQGPKEIKDAISKLSIFRIASNYSSALCGNRIRILCTPCSISYDLKTDSIIDNWREGSKLQKAVICDTLEDTLVASRESGKVHDILTKYGSLCHANTNSISFKTKTPFVLNLGRKWTLELHNQKVEAYFNTWLESKTTIHAIIAFLQYPRPNEIFKLISICKIVRKDRLVFDLTGRASWVNEILTFEGSFDENENQKIFQFSFDHSLRLNGIVLFEKCQLFDAVNRLTSLTLTEISEKIDSDMEH